MTHKKKTINTDVIYILPFGIGDTVGRVALRGDESEAEPCYRLECNTSFGARGFCLY